LGSDASKNLPLIAFWYGIALLICVGIKPKTMDDLALVTLVIALCSGGIISYS